MDSYTEISPSGTGLHLWFTARLPPDGRRTGQVELYDDKRFVTMTGARLEDTPRTVEDRQCALEALHARLFPPRPMAAPRPVRPVVGDADVLVACQIGPRWEVFYQLFDDGDLPAYRQDHSAADLALCRLFAAHTDDPEQIDRLFRRSALFRAKWERDDYRERTLNKALAGLRESTPGRGGIPCNAA